MNWEGSTPSPFRIPSISQRMSPPPKPPTLVTDQCGKYTNGHECVLIWGPGGGKFKMQIPLGKRDSNVATFPWHLALISFKVVVEKPNLMKHVGT